MNVSPAPAGWAVLAASAVLAAGCSDSTATVGQPPGGSLTISAFILKTAADQLCVPPGSSKSVIFNATPVAFTGSGGLTSVTLHVLQMPDKSSQIGQPDIENGSLTFGCERRGTFPNLRPGTWSPSLSGAVSGSCPRALVISGQNTLVRIQSNRCGF
jgi:hypothetical protein